MKYCAYCGCSLDDDAVFCSNCGAKTSKEENCPPLPVYRNPNGNKATGDEDTNPSTLIGILTIVFAFISPIVSIILACVGLSSATSCAKNKTLCKIGLILNIVMFFVSILFYVLIISFMAML